MGMDSFGGRQDMKSDINVTPLVDVCLVLLIIFMVVTPMLQKGKAVMLPQTERPDKKPESNKELLIKADQRLMFGDVKNVMRMIKDGGFEHVGLITEKKAEK